MVYRKSASPLVNLKIEQSAEGQFASDRETITTQMREIAARTKPPHQVAVETSMRDGIEILALNNRIETPGVISMITLMNAGSGVVATAYVLNQQPEILEYTSDEAYATLRDQFIGLLSACMAR